jgi:hypothetical protein
MGKIEEGLKKVNADIDAAADKGLQQAQKSGYTGWILVGVLAGLVLIVWFLSR